MAAQSPLSAGREESRAKLSHFYGLDQRQRTQATADDNAQPIALQAGKERGNTTPGSVRSGRRPSIRRMNSDQASPYDINSSGFDPDMFVNKVVKEASLSQLMAQEGEIVRQIQRLDSDMQTLVYENYNKFIAATETIRKMRVDFKSMEEEMDQLAESMGNITSFSSQISEKLRSRRQDVARLSSTHITLKKLEFVVELPNRLNECLEDNNLTQALSYWQKASTVLRHYRDMPSFAGIQEDCERIMRQVEQRLEERLQDPNSSREQLTEAVQLLQQLGRPAEQLYDSYLAHAAGRLTALLVELEQQLDVLTASESRQGAEIVAIMDPLEFVDHGSNGFLAELTLSITAFSQTFRLPTQSDTPEGASRLLSWVEEHLGLYLAVMQRRLALETDEDETSILVRALDRFYRRLTSIGRVMPGLDVNSSALDVVLNVSSTFCNAVTIRLNARLEESLLGARQTIAAPRRSGGDSPALQLSELANSLLAGVADSVRESVDTLTKFLHPELSFSVKSVFRTRFGQEMVLDSVMNRHLHFIRNACHKFTGEVSVPGGLMLLLSRTCLDLQTNTAPYLAALLADRLQLPATPDISQLTRALADTARTLLDRYVQVEAGELSLMLRKSVEARDWLATVEPRSVRAVMKRIVEDVTIIDGQVGQLYEEGQKKARSSDSSRRTGARSRSAFSSRTLDSSSLASNIQKLFSERIDFFTPVKPAKVSVLTSIIKLGLKTLLECVRLKTFARYGLQQMQVDCHYLQLYLWRFVDDEAVVYHLLDEIMSSAIQRSLDQPPQLMEPSVVEVICDKV